MTNYNERLDEILDNVLIGMYCTNPDGDFVPLYDGKNVLRDGAKQAIASLMKELVAEAKPELPALFTELDDISVIMYKKGADEFKQNLLKALEV